MTTYLVLLRGINVGGKNKVPMAGLRAMLESLGYDDVSTYIASGNAFLRSSKSARTITTEVEERFPREFALDSDLLKVLVLSNAQFRSIVEGKPAGFGDQPDKYYSDVLFLMGIKVADVMALMDPREGVDTVWPGKTVIYSQRLSSERTKSRLNRIMISPLYKSMTIRSWSTTMKLLALFDDAG